MGEYAFLACIVIAIAARIAAGSAKFSSGWIALVLVVLGVIVDLTTITEKEVTPFLGCSSVDSRSSGGWFLIISEAAAKLGTVINSITFNVASFVAPAAIILATKDGLN